MRLQTVSCGPEMAEYLTVGFVGWVCLFVFLRPYFLMYKYASHVPK